MRPGGDGDRRPGAPRDLADGLAGGHRHRHGAHAREDSRDPRRADPCRVGRGGDRARGGVPGGLDRFGGDDARPRRLGCDGGGSGGRVGCRGVRDLHGRRGSLHGRSAAGAAGAQARRALVRGDARARGVGSEGADAALGRVRPQSWCPHPRTLVVVRGGRAPGSSVRRSWWSNRSSRASRTTRRRRR